MTIDEFWALVEDSERHSADLDERGDWLVARLALLDPAEIADFQLRRAEVKRAADTWLMWEAADIIQGWSSDDVFWYFQGWLISLGRAAFEQIAACPDDLAELPELLEFAEDPDDGLGWEVIDYVADFAYAKVTGEKEGLEELWEARGILVAANPDPPGERSEGGAAERALLPRLLQIFGERKDEDES
jgi:hypothetical protein